MHNSLFINLSKIESYSAHVSLFTDILLREVNSLTKSILHLYIIPDSSLCGIFMRFNTI